MIYPGIPLFGISGGEILVLLLLVLLLFGPGKIPEIARMIGKGMGEVRKVQREINSEIQRYSSDIERSAKEMHTVDNDSGKGMEKSSSGVSSVRDVRTPSDAGQEKQDAGEVEGEKEDMSTEEGMGKEADDESMIPYPYRKKKEGDGNE